ncbi:MAG: DUF3341 domain-containing protein [Terracidiphilus sp.]
MANKNMAVFGIFPTEDGADRAVDELLRAGFSNSDISALLPDNETTRAFAHEKHTKAPEGTATGAATGGVVGGTLGLLAGIGALAIPGVGPLIAAGPIVAALAGVGAGGAVGGLLGALVGMGIPEYEAKRFEGAVKNGGTLVSVHCDYSDEIATAKRVLKQAGGQDIASSGEERVSHEKDHDRQARTVDPVYAGTQADDRAYAQRDRERSIEENERERALTMEERERRSVADAQERRIVEENRERNIAAEERQRRIATEDAALSGRSETDPRFRHG